MTLRYIDGFDVVDTSSTYIPTNTFPWRGWTGGNQSFPTTTTVYTGQNSVGKAYGGNGFTLYWVGTAGGTWICGFHLATQGGGYTSGGDILKFFTGGSSGSAGTLVASLGVNSSRQLILKNSAASTVATGTTALPTTNGAFHHVECKWVSDPSAGTFEVRLDGTVEATFTGNTQFGSHTQVDTLELLNPGGAPNICFDNVFIKDDATYLGSCRIATLAPNAVGTTSAWTRVGGTSSGNYTAVNEAVGHDSSTSYVVSANPGDVDTYNCADYTTGGVIQAVQVGFAALRDDTVTARTLAPVVLAGGTTTVGSASTTLSTAYNYYSPTLWATNPTTSVAWTSSDVTSAEFGIKVIT